MKKLLFVIICLLLTTFCNSCAYVLESMINDTGPTITYEYSRSHQVKDIIVTETNWFNGDGNSYWSYTYQKGNQTICSGDCRTK